MTLKTTVLIIESYGLYYCCRRQTRTYSDWSTYKCAHTPLDSTFEAYLTLDVTKMVTKLSVKQPRDPKFSMYIEGYDA